MRILLITILGVALLGGCAHIKTTETNFEEVMKVDIMLDSVNGKLIVQSVVPEGPAATAGLAAGDIIIAMDGKLICRQNEFIHIMYSKQKGDHVSLEINRNGQPLKIDITPRVQKMPPTLLKISSLLIDNKQVKVVVIVGDVKNSFPGTPKDWVESSKNNLQTDEEKGLSKFFEKEKNFTLVDNSKIIRVLDELKINRLELGYVSDELRAKIGEMTGATHIIEITFYRFRRGYGWIDDESSNRLIEVESGNVLAIDKERTYPTFRLQ
jgi:membrane-associated protease RseP (regulator of RpoE activity)